jgi:hypothetical protein
LLWLVSGQDDNSARLIWRRLRRTIEQR